MKTHMPGTAPQIEHARPALPGQLSLQQREFTALGVNGAAQVSGGLVAELLLDDLGVLGGAGHGRILYLRCLSYRLREQVESSHRRSHL